MIRVFAFYALLVTTLFGQTKPNVIFVLCDDLGYGDLGVFYQNSRSGTKKFSTPNLDAMAAQGIQMRAHYTAAPVCAPARASLLLGVHQGHANIRNNQFDLIDIENNHNLATVLKQAGYATAIIGKWGLQTIDEISENPESPAASPAYPTKRGFDFFYGYAYHSDAHSQYPFHTMEDPYVQGMIVNTPKDIYEQDTLVRDDLEKCYTTDLFTARSKKWIVDHRNTKPSQPFFLYLSYTAPHAVLQVPTVGYPEGGGIDGGLQWIGTRGEMINTATGVVDSFIHPDYAGQAWTENEKRFATMIRRIDDGMADLLKTLVDLGIDNNTMVVFTSDNGPHHVSFLSSRYDANSFDSYGPFDGTKRDCWEGGIRVPTLVRWPGTIPAGRISNRPSQFHDWMPTLAHIAGLPAPARSDGKSFFEDLTGYGFSQDGTVYVEYFSNSRTQAYSAFAPSHQGRLRNEMQVIFQDGYKGVRYNVRSHEDPFEIYNLADDPKETTNLADRLPSIQTKMKSRVLRLRRADTNSPRPYDNELIPNVIARVVPGIRWRSYEGRFPWVPDFSGIAPSASGVSKKISATLGSGEHGFGLCFNGFIKVPVDGEYRFYLDSSGGGNLRIHDACVIDDDFGRMGEEKSGTVRLQAGLHPFQIHYRHVSGIPALSISWSGAGITRQPIPTSVLFRRPILSPSAPGILWATTFSGADGTNRILTNRNVAEAFTDTLAADDASLTFQDTTFSGAPFMHSGAMDTGAYYSPQTNVDDPGAANGENGGWWQVDFHYTGGTQTIELHGISMEMIRTNSNGNIPVIGNDFGSMIRDIDLSLQCSTDGGLTWLNFGEPQRYDVTEADGQDQIQVRTFLAATPLALNHAIQDLRLRVRVENTGPSVGAYVNIKSMSFIGVVAPPAPDYVDWALTYPSTDLTHPYLDADGDGLNNNEERLWGLDPASAGSANQIVSPINPATGAFTYSRRHPSLSKAAFTYQYSYSLKESEWVNFTPATINADGTLPVETVIVTVPTSISGKRLFVRAVATEN